MPHPGRWSGPRSRAATTSPPPRPERVCCAAQPGRGVVMVVASGFSWFHLIPSVGHDTLLAGLGITQHTHIVLAAWCVCAVVIGLAGVARWDLERAKARQGVERYFADSALSPRTIAEVYGTALLGLAKDV